MLVHEGLLSRSRGGNTYFTSPNKPIFSSNFASGDPSLEWGNLLSSGTGTNRLVKNDYAQGYYSLNTTISSSGSYDHFEQNIGDLNANALISACIETQFKLVKMDGSQVTSGTDLGIFGFEFGDVVANAEVALYYNGSSTVLAVEYPNDAGYPRVLGSTWTIAPSSTVIPQNQWVTLKLYFNAGNSGQSNSVISLWMNGVLVENITGFDAHLETITGVWAGSFNSGFAGSFTGTVESHIASVIVTTQDPDTQK